MKRNLSFLVVLLLSVGQVLANWDETIDGVIYDCSASLYARYATIKGTTWEFKGVLNISTIEIGGYTYQVTDITDDAVRGNKNLTSVTVNRETFGNIKPHTFEGCENLRTVDLSAINSEFYLRYRTRRSSTVML